MYDIDNNVLMHMACGAFTDPKAVLTPKKPNSFPM